MSEVALKKNSFFSLLVSLVPIFIGIITVPPLIHLLGLERFSFLSIVWAVIGYFGIFDLGLARSLAKRAAQRSSEKNYELLAKELCFGLLVIGFLGVLMAFAVNHWGASLLSSSYQVSPLLMDEARNSVGVIALSIPILMLLSAIKGVFEGLHQFKIANTIQVTNGLASFVVPTLVALTLPNLKQILLALLIFRFLILLSCFFVLHKKRFLKWGLYWDKSLLAEGGWLGLGSLASPLMIYVDRLVLITLLPVKNLAYYTTPVDLVSKAWIVPQAITRVSFPTFTYFSNDLAQKKRAFQESLDLMVLACFAPLILLSFFSFEILEFWIDVDMALNATVFLKILCIGIFWNCLGWVSYSYLQATDGVVIAGVLSMIEVPLYFLALWLLSTHYGLLGASMAWSGRMILDALLIDFYFLSKKTFLTKSILWKIFVAMIFLILSGLSLYMDSVGPFVKIIIGIALIVCVGIYYLKSPHIKQLYNKFFKSVT